MNLACIMQKMLINYLTKATIMKTGIKILTTFSLMIGLNGLAIATPIISGDGTETCAYGAPLSDGECMVQTISTHSRWQPNNPNNTDALWISYADTGIFGSTLAPTSDLPVFKVTETFSANVGDVLDLDVWADDTAEVFINGTSVFSANFSQNICADGVIGCEPGENGTISYTFLTDGLQTLSFDVFQIGTKNSNRLNPFGLLYSGYVATAAVPEPTTLLLMATGLAGLGFGSKRKKKA